MADPIFVTEGKLVADSSLIPFIRRQDVVFEAENLRPRKIARLFFDDIVMNQFSQKGNKLVLDSKKIIAANVVTGTVTAGYYAYQGTSNTSPTFSGYVDAYYSGNTTVVLKTLNGNFDVSANLTIENPGTGLSTGTVKIGTVTNFKTSDFFTKNERIICQNTNTFMTVLGTSGENILYVNENYTTVNIGVVSGNVLSTMTGDYKVGDLLYQITDGNPRANVAASDVSYLGRVEYYNPAVGGAKIALSTISGSLQVNTSTSNSRTRLWNSSNTGSRALQATGLALNDIELNNVIVSVDNISKSVAVTSHVHNSGIIANTAANSIGGNTVFVSSSNTSIATGNLMYFTSGTGMGQFKRITAVSGKQITLSGALDVYPDHTTKYSIGNHIVDDNGNLTGILNIPEEPNFKFKTGDRLFTIIDTDKLDDTDFTMKALAKFTASGLLNKTQRIVSTPVVTPPPIIVPSIPVVPAPPTARDIQPNPTTRDKVDPVAQTFFVPVDKDGFNNGIFVSSVDLFFAAKPDTATGALQLPIQVKIAEVVNGYPTQNYLAVATVKAKDVKISESPNINNSTTYTKFVFDDPVYLPPNGEFALIVYSESPEYEVYIAELGGDVLGANPPRRISEQPYAGSFFRSQNASTWTAYQNQDLMFRINKAVFSGSGTAYLNFKDTPAYSQNVHRLFLHTNDLSFPATQLNYRVRGVFQSNNNIEPSYTDLKPHTLFRYGNLLDASNKADSANFLNSRKVSFGNANSFVIQTEFVTTDTNISPVFNKDSMTLATGEYLINNAGISNTIISIVNRGSGYNAFSSSGNTVYGSTNESLNNAAQLFRQTYLANNYNVGLYTVAISGGQGSGADAFAVANTTGSNTVDYIVINNSGSGYIETPTVAINIGAATGSVRAEVDVQGETGKNGGNIQSKYITRKFTLEDGFEAGDMRIFMDAVIPTGTDIQVYYKVLGPDDTDTFSNKRWVRMFKTHEYRSINQKQLIELEFRPDLENNVLQYSENGVNYPVGGKYKYFAIKVGLLATDSTIVPMISNIRVLATPEG